MKVFSSLENMLLNFSLNCMNAPLREYNANIYALWMDWFLHSIYTHLLDEFLASFVASRNTAAPTLFYSHDAFVVTRVVSSIIL